MSNLRSYAAVNAVPELCPRVWRNTLNLRQILQEVISDRDGEDACRTLVIRHLLQVSSRP